MAHRAIISGRCLRVRILLHCTDDRNGNSTRSDYVTGDQSENITKLLAGHDFAARACCDLDLQGSDSNVARDTSSQYGDHFCIIFF